MKRFTLRSGSFTEAICCYSPAAEGNTKHLRKTIYSNTKTTGSRWKFYNEFVTLDNITLIVVDLYDR